MGEWVAIEGYRWPYRINRKGCVQKQMEDGSWYTLKPYTAAYTFYAIWDEIRMVSDDLERLAGDARVVDAIYAANDVRKRNRTLKTED